MKKKYTDLINTRFGRLTVLECVGIDARHNTIWRCKCDCGSIKDVKRKDLVTNSVRSCGCLRAETIKKFNDLTGQKFGRLRVLSLSHIDNRGHTHWNCQCDCGNTRIYSRSNLLSGTCRSCGCLRSELSSKRASEVQTKWIHTKYGKFQTGSHILKSYRRMVARCYDPNNASYEIYHNNSITVTNDWYNPSRVDKKSGKYRDEIGMVQFINDMYESYMKHVERHGEHMTTLDRIDGTKSYNKSNCRWATPTVQNNNLSSNRHIFDGEEILTFSECARKYIPKHLFTGSFVKAPGEIINTRLHNGWTVNQVIRFLQHAKTYGELLEKKDLKYFLIRKVDQSVVYDKYPNEARLPGYELI